jgi:hypothetical protein
MRRVSLWLCSTTLGLAFLSFSYAQSPPAARNAAATPKMEVHATLAQLMRGILYPASNVIFAAQSDDPAKIKPAANPSLSPDLLTSTYGQWQAVENSALAITETANLLALPGRKCSNGVDVPLRNADWTKFVQELRAAGLQVYKASQAKSQDDIVAAADPLTTACSNCHDKYREKPNLAERCK